MHSSVREDNEQKGYQQARKYRNPEQLEIAEVFNSENNQMQPLQPAII
jgi:hypothetical protein